MTAMQGKKSESRAKWIWGGLIVGLLFLQILISFSAAYLSSATSSSAAIVVDDFHQQGLEWDHIKAKQLQSDQLNWTLTTSLSPWDSTSRNLQRMQLILRDDENKPVTGGAGELMIFHHANANEKQRVPLTESPPASGIYNAKLVMHKAGLWQLELEITAQKKTFLYSETQQLD